MALTRHFRTLLVAGALLGLGGWAHGAVVSISGLYTTGVNNSSTLLGNNVQDSHYVVTASSEGSSYLGNTYTVSSGALDSGWTANTSTARWVVAPDGGSNGADPSRPAGTYDYTLTFNMPSGAQLSWVSISGTGAADQSAAIYVNGVLVSGQSIAGSGSTSSFTLNASNASFTSGTNTITFRVTNEGKGRGGGGSTASGLFIASLSGTVVVPETGAWLPAAGAMALYGLVSWRRRVRAIRRR